MKHKPLDEVINEAEELFFKKYYKDTRYKTNFCYGWLREAYESLYEDHMKLRQIAKTDEKVLKPAT